MDYEYDDEPLEGRILWGRLAVYGIAFALVFLLGNCMGSGGGPSEEEVDELTTQVRALASENAVLEQQLAAATAGNGQSAPTTDSSDQGQDDGDPGAGGETESAGDGAGDGGGDGGATEAPADPQAQTYTVQSGDTLYEIATEFYGDGSKWRLIADANGLDDDNRLTVGQELRIPPDA